MTEHTGDCYKTIASNYARVVDDKPWHTLYERPGTLSLLPPLEGKNLLDVGCGTGWYAEYCSSRGARVTAIDLNAEFIAMTKARIGDRIRVLQADLSKPLDFAADHEFDLVVCPLVMHYLQDWLPAFSEFRRILVPEGLLVFSTHHPFMDWHLFQRDNYFSVERLDDEWAEIGKVSYYRRPLTRISADLHAAGFVIERLLEPLPDEEMRTANPEGYEKLCKNPWFLFVRARRDG